MEQIGNRWQRQAALSRDNPSNTHTVADLWAGIPTKVTPDGQIVPVEPYIGERPIRLYAEVCTRQRPTYKDKLLAVGKEAYIEYKARARHGWWQPKLNGRFDTFRWNLHRFLLRWKIII